MFPNITNVYVYAYREIASFAGLSIFPSSMIGDKSLIEHSFKTRKQVATAVVRSWIEVCMIVFTFM